MNMAAIVWLVLMVVFLAAEASTVSMVSLWFAAGALIALLTALAGGPAWLQTLLFLAVSAGLLLALRPHQESFSIFLIIHQYQLKHQ